MNSKTRNLKSGNENGVIIAILAVLLVIVAAIVGVVVLKDNAAVATFDGGKVTKKEYQVYYEMFSDYLKSYGYDAESIPGEILSKAAQDKMILADAKAAGVKISDEDKAEVDEIFNNEEYINYFKTNYSFSIDALRQVYYNDYIIQDYIEKMAFDADAASIEEYIKSKYSEGEEVDMREFETLHILFSFNGEDGNILNDEQKAELKKEAEGVLARVKAGEDFAKLAEEYSDDTATAKNGGVYKMYNDGYTVKEYGDAVAKLKVGEVSETLVETTYGYHIIKLQAINDGGRTNSETERREYANSLVSDIEKTKNLQYDEEKFKNYVLSIDPNAYTKTDTTNDQQSTTVDSTTTDEGTTEEQ